MSDIQKWWIDDVEESVCARVDHFKRGLDKMPWPDCDHVHIVMLVSDHEKEITTLKEREKKLIEVIKSITEPEGMDQSSAIKRAREVLKELGVE